MTKQKREPLTEESKKTISLLFALQQEMDKRYDKASEIGIEFNFKDQVYEIQQAIFNNVLGFKEECLYEWRIDIVKGESTLNDFFEYVNAVRNLEYAPTSNIIEIRQA